MKHHSLDLLDAALKKKGLSERGLSRELGLSPSALSVSRHKGNLSPALAAAIAADIGEDVGKWTLVAVAESERGTSLKARIARLAEGINSYFSRLLKRPRPSHRNRKP